MRGDDVDGLDRSRNKSTLDKHESRKKKCEESTLDMLSSWYQDGDAENKLDTWDKPGSGVYSRAEEREKYTGQNSYIEPIESNHVKSRGFVSKRLVYAAKKNRGRFGFLEEDSGERLQEHRQQRNLMRILAPMRRTR
ncbi:hypothetical protein OROMI_010398 [Orobanche minor]